MSVHIPVEARRAAQGLQLTQRATGVVAADVDLFSIDGGAVELHGFWGRVTTAIGGGSQDIGLLLDPDDGGSNVVLGDNGTPLAIDADPVGTYYTLGATVGADMVATLDFAQPALFGQFLVLEPGDIVLDVTGTEAGSVEWAAIWRSADGDGGVLTAV